MARARTRTEVKGLRTEAHGRRSVLSPQSSVLKAAAIAAALLAAGCAAAPPPGAGPAAEPRGGGHSRGFAEIQRMVFPPLDLRFPRVGREVERRVLPNGLVLYLYPDRRLPLVEATAMIRGGTAYEGEGTWTAMLLMGD